MEYSDNVCLKYQFDIMNVGGENVAMAVGKDAELFPGMIRLQNASAEFLFRCLEEPTTPERLVERCLEEYTGSTEEEIWPAVENFLDSMERAGILVIWK